MSFMEPEILDKARVFELDTRLGTFYVPDSVVTPPISLRDNFAINESVDPWLFERLREWCGQYCEGGPGSIQEIKVVFGYLGRYQAPGYMDSTDWHFGTNYRELLRELRDMYGD